MSNHEPTPFHSSFSAEEIQATLMSVQHKINKVDVLLSMPADPDDVKDEHIASAKLLQAALTEITEYHQGPGFAAAIANITDNNLFSDANKSKLDRIGGSARGIVADVSQRDAKFPDPTDLNQGDYILVISDAGGFPSFQYWDITLSDWVDAYKSTGSSTTTIAAVGTAEVAVFSRTQARSARYTVTATRDTVTQMWDVFVTHDGPGNAVYVNVLNEVKTPASSAHLVTFTADKSPDGSLIVLQATSTNTNVKVDVQRITLL